MHNMPMAVFQHDVKLPVFETLLRSVQLLVKNWLALLKYSLPTMLVFTGLFFQDAIAALWGDPFDYRVQLVTQLVMFLAFWIGSVISGVAFHHVFLKGGSVISQLCILVTMHVCSRPLSKH